MLIFYFISTYLRTSHFSGKLFILNFGIQDVFIQFSVLSYFFKLSAGNGFCVRRSKYKNIFAKDCTLNWSEVKNTVLWLKC